MCQVAGARKTVKVQVNIAHGQYALYTYDIRVPTSFVGAVSATVLPETVVVRIAIDYTKYEYESISMRDHFAYRRGTQGSLARCLR